MNTSGEPGSAHCHAEQRTEPREPLPVVAADLRQQAPLAVHDLVMAERQDEALVVGVQQRERHLVVVVTTVDRVEGHVAERVVHPAEIPLVTEAQPARRCRRRHARPRRRFLGDHQHVGEFLADHGVRLAQEADGVEVLPPTELVGHPAAGVTGVVEVQHRRHRVDTQPVDVEFVEQVERVGDQEVAHLVAPEVEHVRAPLGMFAAPGIGVLVQRSAVEPAEAPLVTREVRRHPVDDHADAALVQRIDEARQPARIAEASGRRVVPRHLIAPRATERMLGHRQQLDVGEPQ